MARLRQLDLPNHTVSLKIDESKCLGPFKCGECLKNCPAAVFNTYPVHREKGKICDDWGIEASREVLCWGCGVCQDKCPVGAIEIMKI